jgi:hypothetical protein
MWLEFRTHSSTYSKRCSYRIGSSRFIGKLGTKYFGC